MKPFVPFYSAPVRPNWGAASRSACIDLFEETILISKNFQQKSLVLSGKADGCLFDQLPLTFSSEGRDSHPFGQSPHELISELWWWRSSTPTLLLRATERGGAGRMSPHRVPTLHFPISSPWAGLGCSHVRC